MKEISQNILSLIKSSNGLKTSEIAQKLSLDKNEVKTVLFTDLKDICYQDIRYKWYFYQDASSVVNNKKSADTKLSKLCGYYLNCLNIEDNNSISEFLLNNYSLKYSELQNLDITSEKNIAAVNFLHKILSSPNKNIVTYVGYPVMIEKIFSSKNNKSYLKVAPVFLFSVEYNSGEINVSAIPSINKEVIKQYSTQNSEDNLIYEIIELEKQLGLDIADNNVELDDLISRLQQLRQWAWKEEMNPESLANETPIQDINTEGIYNRAIIIATEKSPYTLGLESELSELSKLDESEYKGTALYDWINSSGTAGKIKDGISDDILEVLPLNSEQEQAVRTSLASNVTILSGPPGTGKSQVVTDLLVNAIWKGQNVLFTSKNNKAVDVVEARLNNLSNRPVMLRISAAQNNTNILSVINTLLSTTVNLQDKVDYENLSKTYFEEVKVYDALRDKKEACIALRNKVDKLEQKICASRELWQKYYPDLTSKQIDDFNASFNVVSKHLYKTIKEKQNWLIKLLWPILLKSRKNKLINAITLFNIKAEGYGIAKIPENLNEMILQEYALEFKDCIENMYSIIEYQDLLSALAVTETLESIDRKLWKHKNSLAKKSETLWDKWLLARPINISPAERQNMSRFVSALKLQQGKNIGSDQKFAKELTNMHKLVAKFLPCWAVTSLSAKGRIPFSPAIYDLLVIDEASQCDIASMLPLLYRTKRVVIIGDNKQLPHISSISKKQDVSLLQKYNVDYEWTYSSNSIFDLTGIVNTSPSIVNLLDHHRSFADIIEFSNKEFYGGKLRVATDYRKLKLPKNEAAGVRWIDVKGKVLKPYNGGAFNNAEIKQIIEELNRLAIQNDYQGSIGVVTPFRVQADKIRDEIEKLPELKNRLYAQNDFLVDTVHKFQGDERDVIIFSSVISQNTPLGAIIFLKNTGNLFNVAITRARSILTVVGDKDYCSHCNVPYMEHFVEYTKELENKLLPSGTSVFYPETRDYPAVQNIEQVSEWEKYLYTKLYDVGIVTTPQYPVDKYKLDLAVIVNDKKKLDIEVDGEMYHRAWNCELCYRDQLRNQRLFELGWDVKRFWVYQIRDQLPWCIEQIRKWLQ